MKKIIEKKEPKVGDVIKISRTEYTLLGEFTDDGEKFFIAKCYSHGKWKCVEYCAIGWDYEYGYYRHR